MKAFDELAQVSKTLQNKYVKDWKEQGKKVVGYVCSYLPEEILYAADILPYRITGKGATDTSRADSYLSRFNCSFARCCLEQRFEGEYDFLDGAIWVNGCDHIRRCYDNWHAKAPLAFMHMLPVPHKIFDEGRQWFKEEVTTLKKAIEDHFDLTITSEQITKATTTYNETRRLLKKLYDLRANKETALTGAETLTIVSAGTVMPKDAFNRILGELIQEVEENPKKPNGGIRLLVAGSLMDDPEFLENVEALGALVVTDALCFGTKNFWDLTEETGDIFENLIDRYYYHAPCPRMAGGYADRLSFIKKQIDRADVKGAILEHIKFCDLHGTDNALLKRDLEKDGITVLELERQYGPLADAGRVRTRVQAFLERIGG